MTGSLVTGTLSRDQKLELLPPERQAVRVRRLEVHGREVSRRRGPARGVSANLAGIELADVRRGVVLAAPEPSPRSALLTARLELLAGASPVKSGDRVSFHHYSSEARAVLRILEGKLATRRRDGQGAAPAFASRRGCSGRPIRRAPSLSRRDDRRRSRARPALASRCAARRRSCWRTSAGWTEASLRDSRRGSSRAARKARERNRSPPGAGASREEVRALCGAGRARERARALRHSPERYIGEEVLARLAVRARAEIEKGFDESSGAVGVSRGTLLARLLPSADPRWTEALRRSSSFAAPTSLPATEARLPGREDLPGVERDLSERVADAFRRRGLDPPSIADVTREVGHKPKVVEGLAAYLVKKGALLRLPGRWIIAREPVEDVIARLRATGKTSFDVGEFTEMFGLTRRLAIPLLEYLDATKSRAESAIAERSSRQESESSTPLISQKQILRFAQDDKRECLRLAIAAQEFPRRR